MRQEIRVLLFLAVVIVLFKGSNSQILLQNIPTLTLYRNEYTAGSKPIPQLECVGGTASGMHSPKVVQCYNRGSNGQDVQWECKAELPMEYQFGRIEVSCENYRGGPQVVIGSCGLRYQLDYSAYGAKQGGSYFAYPSKRSWFTFERVVQILVIAFVIYLLYLMFVAPSDSSSGAARGGAGGGGSSWGPPPDDRRPPPPGWNPPPPSYDDATSGSTKGNYHGSGGSGNSGPGFFSGLGLGALGGYLFGRNNNDYGGYGGYGGGFGGSNFFGGYGSGGYSRYRGNRGSGGFFNSSSDFGSGPSTSSGSSGGTHTSSGYGGTSRR